MSQVSGVSASQRCTKNRGRRGNDRNAIGNAHHVRVDAVPALQERPRSARRRCLCVVRSRSRGRTGGRRGPWEGALAATRGTRRGCATVGVRAGPARTRACSCAAPTTPEVFSRRSRGRSAAGNRPRGGGSGGSAPGCSPGSVPVALPALLRGAGAAAAAAHRPWASLLLLLWWRVLLVPVLLRRRRMPGGRVAVGVCKRLRGVTG